MRSPRRGSVAVPRRLTYVGQMKKPSVYLTDDEDQALNRAAEATGLTRSELIREGIRAVVIAHLARPRAFHSMGRGHSGSPKLRRWTSEELCATRRGRRACRCIARRSCRSPPDEAPVDLRPADFPQRRAPSRRRVRRPFGRRLTSIATLGWFD
jgi:hypothetical protein